jgi:hypothetical protein
MYDALGGRRAYAAADPASVARLVARGAVSPLFEHAPWVDRALSDVVMSALAPDPAARPTAAQMSGALASWTARLGAGSSSDHGAPSPLQLSAATAPTVSQATGTTATSAQGPAGWGPARWLALAGLALVMFAVGAVSLFALSRRGTGDGLGSGDAGGAAEAGAAPVALVDAASPITGAGPSPALAGVRLGASCEDAPDDLGRGVGMGCSAPAMIYTCFSGFESCGSADRCFDLRTDASHCGACSKACKPGQSCRLGKCVASAGPAPSSPSSPSTTPSVPTTPQRIAGEPRAGDPCPSPGTVDPQARLYCSSKTKTWACQIGDLVCDHACASSHSRRSCGACGVRCQADEGCMPMTNGTSQCVPCDWTSHLCGDLCIPAGPLNCGRCGDACAPGKVCQPRGPGNWACR